MTKKEALAFLALNQPMPNDYDITQELINKYNNVRLYFLQILLKKPYRYFYNRLGKVMASVYISWSKIFCTSVIKTL